MVPVLTSIECFTFMIFRTGPTVVFLNIGTSTFRLKLMENLKGLWLYSMICWFIRDLRQGVNFAFWHLLQPLKPEKVVSITLQNLPCFLFMSWLFLSFYFLPEAKNSPVSHLQLAKVCSQGRKAVSWLRLRMTLSGNKTGFPTCVNFSE